MNRNSFRIQLAVVGLCVGLAPQRVLAAPDKPAMPPSALAFVQRALPHGLADTTGDGRTLFAQVLAGPAFVRAAAGPFDVHVFVGDALPTEREARKVLDGVLRTLQPAARLVAQRWPEGGGGLISAARLPLVIVDPGESGASYRQLLALLDHCEQLGYSGWAPANAVDTPENRDAEMARTWEVQIYDLSHPRIAESREEWIGHGVGYNALALVANRALCQGAWGLAPNWLIHGVTDELDIAAYGQAWIGPGEWSMHSPGSHRPGAPPPAPDTGPSPSMAAAYTKSGHHWLDHKASRTRHWEDLVGDRKTKAPASVARSAECESLQPRDRAAARCLLSLMSAVAPDRAGPLTALLDRPARIAIDGMPDSDPLPVLLARALGGVADVDRLESLTTRALLDELGRADLLEKLTALRAEGVLELSDHREQARWLYGEARFARDERVAVFNAILEVEHVQQLAEWKALSAHLDSALEAALSASRTYPVRDRDVAKVAEAFRAGLASDPAPRGERASRSARRGSPRSRP